MRSDPLVFVAENESQSKRARYVIAIELPVESIYLTSHEGISGVPGVVIENCLQEPSAISQRIVPDEGRSEIGSFSFSLVDLGSAFTDEVRDNLLNDGVGLRGKKVRFYIGYARTDVSQARGFGSGPFGGGGFGEDEDYEPPEAVFSQFQLFQTQIITDVSYDQGVYEVQCSDITREQRKEIFEPKRTTLRDSVTAAATTIPVYSTVAFQPVYHGTSYSDGPNGVFGYIKLENEVIRYTGTTVDTFTGCTRGVLNTKAVAHEVDAGSEEERRPKVEEYIYIELPAVKAAYAINTGIIHGTSPTQTLPPHWHLGISTDLVKLDDFTGILDDLWNPSNDNEGFIVRFTGLNKTDGKRFLETEIYQLLGCYSPVYSDGRIGLKRMNQVLANAAYVVELNDLNVVSTSPLQHDLSGMHNQLRIDWNWNGDRFTRTTLFIDSNSVSTHGAAPLKTLKFKGLHGARHTEAVIRKRLDAFRDRYTSPPETISVDVLTSLDKVEVGDVVRLKLASIRDFAGESASIDRSMEVQRKSGSSSAGRLTFDLFGSTDAAGSEAPNDTGSGNALPDAFYTATGTELSTVTTIVVVGGVGVIQAGTYNLTAGIYYYDGDLELADGATLTINDTVQIRVAGFFTINGDIDGVGRGKAGQADVPGWGNTQTGLPGFIGNSRGMDGIVLHKPEGIFGFVNARAQTVPCAFTQGLNSSFPFIELQVSGNDLLGVPTDLAGTSGGAGGKLAHTRRDSFDTGTVTSDGGTGADSGAGLVIVCRGLALGASGEIDLSGDSPAATSINNNPFDTGGGESSYPGPGGAGGPGALFIALDGSGNFIPDLGGKFIAATGTIPIDGTAMPIRGPERLAALSELGWGAPFSGFIDPSMISAVDLSNVAFRIQYIPGVETPQEDQSEKPPAPTNLVTATAIERIVLAATVANLQPGDLVEFYASADNNRTNAVLAGYGAQSLFIHNVPVSTTRFYWARIRRPKPGVDSFSEFYPLSATGGVVGTSSTVDNEDISSGAVSQRFQNGDIGPVVSTGDQVVLAHIFSATHAGEVVYDWSWREDSNSFSGGSYLSALTITDSGGIVNASSLDYTSIEESPNVVIWLWSTRATVLPGTVTIQLATDGWTGTGSVSYSEIKVAGVLLKR